jgi:hypothetical protein
VLLFIVHKSFGTGINTALSMEMVLNSEINLSI